jgi:hypothetical protein
MGGGGGGGHDPFDIFSSFFGENSGFVLFGLIFP